VALSESPCISPQSFSPIEVARRDGVGHTATAIRTEHGKLKRLMLAAAGVAKRMTTPSFMELIAPEAARCAVRDRTEGRRSKIRIEPKANAVISQASAGRWGSWVCDPDHTASTHSGCGGVDGRKGIDLCARLPGETCLRCSLLIFSNRSARAIQILAYDGQGFWLATTRLSKGCFRWWPTGREAGRGLRASGPDAAGGW
jgi:hypothetical protein